MLAVGIVLDPQSRNIIGPRDQRGSVRPIAVRSGLGQHPGEHAVHLRLPEFVQAGTTLVIRATRVRATNTTATNIVRLW